MRHREYHSSEGYFTLFDALVGRLRESRRKALLVTFQLNKRPLAGAAGACCNDGQGRLAVSARDQSVASELGELSLENLA